MEKNILFFFLKESTSDFIQRCEELSVNHMLIELRKYLGTLGTSEYIKRL